LLVATTVVYSPWPVRNSLLLGQLVLGSSESTEWLWRGTNARATGSSFTVDREIMLESAPAAFQARVAAASEVERIGIYQEAALQFIREQPAHAAGLYVDKFKSFWLGSESTGMLYPPAWTPIYDAWYAAVLLLAAGGLWWGLRTPSGRSVVVLIVISLLLVAAAQAVFYVEGRHRLAVEPLLLVLAGGGLARLGSYVRLPAVRAQRLRDARDTPS
jgi:hypothetical protein